MKSNQTSSFGTRGFEPGLTNRGALETVQIASDLIAFYPQAIHQQQPYVILLDPASGILKRLDLGSRSLSRRSRNGDWIMDQWAYYAIQRGCGHMNAPLELGTLDGNIVTCPMHCAQFDVTTGQALSGPVPGDLGNETLPP